MDAMACAQASGVSDANVSHQARLPAIWRTTSEPSSKDSCGRKFSPTAGSSTAVTSASPECAADTGTDPQHAASASTIPNASGNVLGTTSASDALMSSETSECSMRPVKCTRLIAAGAALRYRSRSSASRVSRNEAR